MMSVMSAVSRALLCSTRKHDCAQLTPYHLDMPSKTAIALATNTKRLMDERGWSQRDLAKRSGVSQSGIGFVLRYKDASDRHAALDTVEALARAFGVDPSALLQNNPSTVARTLHIAGQRRASTNEVDRDEHALDTVTLQHVIEQMELIDEGTPAQRAAVMAAAYSLAVEGGKKPAKAALLKLLRSA